MLPLILIVDDKPEMAKIISMFLKSFYRTSSNSNGIEALAFLESSTELPSLIISDIRMPDMDGYTLLSTLKSIPKFAKIPVLILSSIESSADRVKAFEMGADDFLLKPFNPEELRLRIVKLLK